jgi:hypothetical protein
MTAEVSDLGISSSFNTGSQNKTHPAALAAAAAAAAAFPAEHDNELRQNPSSHAVKNTLKPANLKQELVVRFHATVGRNTVYRLGRRKVPG